MRMNKKWYWPVVQTNGFLWQLFDGQDEENHNANTLMAKIMMYQWFMGYVTELWVLTPLARYPR